MSQSLSQLEGLEKRRKQCQIDTFSFGLQKPVGDIRIPESLNITQ